MKVKKAIHLLSKMDPDADVCLDLSALGSVSQGVTGDARLVSEFSTGWYVVDSPGMAFGCHVDYNSASTIQVDGKPLLDLTSPNITPAIFIRWRK